MIVPALNTIAGQTFRGHDCNTGQLVPPARGKVKKPEGKKKQKMATEEASRYDKIFSVFAAAR